MSNRRLAREMYEAFAAGYRDTAERLLADDFAFHSPPDPALDRAGYFERCWPNHETIASYEFERLIEHGDEVIVTYEATKSDGRRLRNTEILTFGEGKLRRAEVYFGWDLPD
jgi:ketosteroid isomerase-like protein